MPSVSAASSTSVRVIRNTVINSASGLVNAVLVVLLTPFFLSQLGEDVYGIWLLATVFTLTQGFGLADLGLRATGVRYIAAARGREDFTKINLVASTLTALFIFLGVTLGVLLGAFASKLSNGLGVPEGLVETGTTVFMLVGLQLPIDMAASGFQAVVEGYERYGLVRLALVGTRVIWAVSAVIALMFGAGVIAVALTSVGAAILALIFSVWAAGQAHPGLRVAPKYLSRGTLWELLSFGASFTVLKIASVVYSQMDKLIVASVLTAGAVTRYDISYKVHAIAALFLSLPASAILPTSALLGAQEDQQRLKALYLRGTRLAVGLGLPVTLAALIHTEQIVVAWVGEEYRNLTGSTRLFLIYPLMVAFHNVASSMFLGTSRMRISMGLGVSTISLNLVLSIVLSRRMGIDGVIWGTQISFMAIWIPYLLLSFREFGVSFREWWLGVLRPNLVAPIVQVLLGLISIRIIGATPSAVVTIGAVGTNVAIGALLFGLVGLPTAERQAMRKALLPS